MGVVNVTPDSFSDGGLWFDGDTAVRHGLDLVAEGADIVDVGGESTRPGAPRVDEKEELRRVVPVVTELARAGVFVSVDTMRVAVADAALEAGARMVNDVSGGLADPDMPRVVARAKVPYVVMHWRGHSHRMQERAVYADVLREVRDELRQRMDAVIAEGVDPEAVIVDPGIGFAKTAEYGGHNWQLLAGLDELRELGRPILLATSRKTFLGRLLAAGDGTPRPPAERDAATVATTALAAAAGTWCVRVHDVRPNADAVRVSAAWQAARRPAGHAARQQVQQQVRQQVPVPSRPGRVALRGLRAHGRHGVYQAERESGQEFVVDAVLGLDVGEAARTDDLSRTVDYGGLAERLTAVVEGGPVNLIETLAERLAAVCLDEPAVAEVEVTVHKPHAPVRVRLDDVTVTIFRSRR